MSERTPQTMPLTRTTMALESPEVVEMTDDTTTLVIHSAQAKEIVASCCVSEQLIVSDPAVRGGEYVIAGTRFPVWHVQDMHDNGQSIAQMLDSYPALRGHEAGIAAAIAFPRRREVTVYDADGAAKVFCVRESWTTGYAEFALVSEPLAYAELPGVIAALEQAREWGDA